MMKGGTSSRFSPQSTLALQRLFQWVESKYGGLPIDTGRAAEVIVRDRLEAADLSRLFQHEALALHVPGFFETNAATKLGDRLASEANAGKGRNWKVSTSRGLESSDVSTLGEHPPYNVASASSEASAEDDYFSGVVRELATRRLSTDVNGLLSPQLWPLDLFRLQLDEAWPAGGGLARETSGDRRPFSGGLPRIMQGPTRWRKGLIHVDEMGPLNPKQGLFSANIYLRPPDDEDPSSEQGVHQVLHIWPVGIRSRWDWYRNAILLSGLSSQDPEDQIRLRSRLGPPTTLSVRPGDLVLLCVQRPHAAIGFASGTRVSLQCFVQYHGPDQRLLVDS